MATAKSMTELYEDRKDICAKYVHATSRGHEAIQLATGFLLKPQDYAFPYYRDDAMLLGMGFTPYDLMLQLLARRTDYFSGGRTYYSHPSSNREDLPKIPHQSSATGMQAIPATGTAQGMQYKEQQGIAVWKRGEEPIVLCSMGDASVTEGEVAEAFQMASLHDYPIIYLVQDNEWDISAHSSEIRKMDANEYAKGFKGLRAISINGSDFNECYDAMDKIISLVRKDRKPYLVHVKVPLLNHHTSGVRKEWYRPKENLESDAARDPYPVLKQYIKEHSITSRGDIDRIEEEARQYVAAEFEKAVAEPNPTEADLMDHIFAPTPITEEKGERSPAGGQTVVMVDAALHAVDEIMRRHPESLLYGQDVGGELGGVFREAALLAKKYGDQRVFNTPIMEAYIVGSTVGMSAVGCKPIVEVQFADYIFPGINQLFTEVSRSCYLSNGKWPVQMLLRVPIGAYGSGGPYHYWSKVKGTEVAKTVEPDEHYIIPLGKGRVALAADEDKVVSGETMAVITYGMGVHWAMNAAKQYEGQIEVIDLRSLNPLDDELIEETVKKHGKVMVLTEETVTHSFAEALAGRIASQYFQNLDASIKIIGAKNVPAIPLNENLEKALLPNIEQVAAAMGEMLNN